MDITKVKIKSDYSLFDKLWFKGDIFYISQLQKDRNFEASYSQVFDSDKNLLGTIGEHWFDFRNKAVFEAA